MTWQWPWRRGSKRVERLPEILPEERRRIEAAKRAKVYAYEQLEAVKARQPEIDAAVGNVNSMVERNHIAEMLAASIRRRHP